MDNGQLTMDNVDGMFFVKVKNLNTEQGTSINE